MKTMRVRACAGGVVAVLLAAACGGSQYEKAPAASPASGASPETPTAAPAPPSSESVRAAPADEQSAPAPASRASAAPEATTASADRERGGGRQAALARDRSEIDAAERILATSAGDCAAACRALGSMDRAAGHLCELAESTDERGRCADAKARLRAARDRVLRTCGSCPGGPSLERNAPIPSR